LRTGAIADPPFAHRTAAGAARTVNVTREIWD